MKTKSAKQPKRSDTKMKDIKPKKDAKGGAGNLLLTTTYGRGTTASGAYSVGLVVDPNNPN